MSIKAVSWALEQSLKDATGKLVLIALADRYNDEYGHAWPSVAWLATAGDCSERTIRRKLRDLEAKGYISVTHRHNETSSYKLPMYENQWGLSQSHVGDNLTGGDITVSAQVGDIAVSAKQYHTNNNTKYNIDDLVLDDAMRKYAEDLGLDADEVFTDIKLWDESNAKKKKYASLTAFWQSWCRREAKRSPRASKSQEKAVKVRELSDRQVEFARSKAEKLFMKHKHEGFAFQSILDDCLAYLKTNGGDDAWRSIGNGLENPFS